jgi:hypothetical protein
MISLKNKGNSTRTILFVLAISLLLMIISSVFIVTETHEDMGQLTGQIIAIENNLLTISDARGRQNIIYIDENTTIRKKDKELAPGVFIISFGKFNKDGNFVSAAIRVIKKQ